MLKKSTRSRSLVATQAGADKSPFSVDAISVLHEASGGRLRDLDRIATNALKRAARRKVRVVDRTVISDVLEER